MPAFRASVTAIAIALSSLAGAADHDPEIDAMMELDRATIEGVSWLVMCEDTMRTDYGPLWRVTRDYVKGAIGDIIANESRALVRYDDIEKSAKGSNPPMISDPDECMAGLDSARHKIDVARARLAQARSINP